MRSLVAAVARAFLLIGCSSSGHGGSATCGDGDVSGTEACDDANLGGNDGTGEFVRGALACAADCSSFDTTGCAGPGLRQAGRPQRSPAPRSSLRPPRGALARPRPARRARDEV
jgi:cysteine-rich repeat protein